MIRALALSSLVLLGCKAAKNADPPDTGEHDTAEHDTGAIGDPEPPRCAVPEAEPNDAPDQANPLAFEALGCGDVAHPLDVDQWTFDVTGHGWIGVYVEAEAIGSRANPAVAMLSDDHDAVVYYGDQGQCTGGDLPPCARDVHLRFPASPATWTFLVSEEDALGAEEDYHYEVLVTAIKEPVDWTDVEVEDNGAAARAQPLSPPARVFGGAADGFDTDWYRIDVPSGKHTLVMRVDAYTYGSAGDFMLTVRDASLEVQTRRVWGERGWERDPHLVYTSGGDETLYVQVTEQRDRGGSAYWYVLDVTMEGE